MNLLNDNINNDNPKALRQNSALLTLVAAGGEELKKRANITEENRALNYSRTPQTWNGINHPTGKIATMEPGLWPLDGSCMLLPQSGPVDAEVGWVSSVISGQDGMFATAPEANIRFDTPANIPCVTMIFDHMLMQGAPRRIRCEFFNSANAIILDRTFNVDPQHPYSVTIPGLNNITRVRIRFLDTLVPFRRLRVTEFYFAPAYVFGPEDVISINTVHQGDPEGKALPYNQLRAKLTNKGRFDVLNENSLLPLLSEGSLLCYTHGTFYPNSGRKGPIFNKYAAYYIEKWSVNKGFVEITAHSAAKHLDRGIFMDSHFPLEIMGDLARRIGAAAGVEVITPHIMNTFPRYPGFVGNVTYRQALSYLAELASCLIYEDKKGAVHFVDLFSVNQGELKEKLDFERLFEPPLLTQNNYYNGVTLTEHMISLDWGWLANFSMDVNGLADIVIPYDVPIWGNGEITVTQGFSLQNIEQHTMYMTARLAGTGRCTVEVRGWRVLMLSQQQFYPAPWKKEGETEKPYMVNLPMFISNAVHIQSVRDWFLGRKFGLLRQLIFCEANHRQNMKNELGDNVMVQIDPDGREIRQRAHYQEMNFENGVLSGTTKGVVVS